MSYTPRVTSLTSDVCVLQLEKGFKEGLGSAKEKYGKSGEDEITDAFNDLQKTVCIAVFGDLWVMLSDLDQSMGAG